MAWIKHYASKLAYLLWLTPSGQVAHATLDRRLCRTRIFIDVLAELVEKYGDKVLDTISDGVNSSNVCDYIFIANGMSVLCEAEKITNADILKAYVQVAYANGLIAKSA